MLSGFMFPFRGMPQWAQWIGEFFPLTHFLRVVRAVMLKGAGFSDIAFEASILVLFVAVYGALALARFRSTLD
jgi:ABC-2 type transport system permease protein